MTGANSDGTRFDLPVGWAWGSIGGACLAVDKIEPASAPEASFRYIDISAIDRTTKTIGDVPRLLGQAAPSRARQVVRTGDVLVSTVRPNLQTVAVVPSELDGEIASTGFSVLRPGQHLNPRWLLYWTFSPAFLESLLQKARGVSYPAVLDRDVRAEPIPLPPLEEQHRLVALIDDLLGRLTSGKRDLERTLDEIRLFERSSVAQIAGRSSPPRVRLDDVGQVFVGATPRRDEASFWGGGIPWVSSGEVTFDRVVSTRETITEAGLGDRAKRLQPAGSVLIAMYGDGKTRGRSAILDIDAATNQAIASVRVDAERAVPDFIYHCLVQQYEAIREIGSGTQQKNLSKGLVAALEVPCPPLDVQRRAVAEFQALHAETGVLRKEVVFQREASDRLRTALLSSAFAGHV